VPPCRRSKSNSLYQLSLVYFFGMVQLLEDCTIYSNCIIHCSLFQLEYFLDSFPPFSAVCSLICGVNTELFLRGALTARRKLYLVGDISHEATPEILRIKKIKKKRNKGKKKGKKKERKEKKKGTE